MTTAVPYAVMNVSNTTNTSLTSVFDRYTEDELYAFYSPLVVTADRYVTPVWYIIGVIGNTLAFSVWTQRRMRHSSGCYLSALAMSDLVFLVLQFFFELQSVWKVKVIARPGLCEIYPIIYIASQHLSPLLVLGFTVERYISICHPFKREEYCTTKRAVKVVIGLIVLSLLLNAVQGYFWSYQNNDCSVRMEALSNGSASFWSVWTWLTEMLIFALVPLAVLVFNILVIMEARKLARSEEKRLQLKRGGRKSATTFMLLAVSFYLIFTTLPVTICYAIYFSFPQGDEFLSDKEIDFDPTWQRHFTYRTVRIIVQEFGMSHYACNFFIYLLTGKIFRLELRRILLKVFCRRTDRIRGYEYESEMRSNNVKTNGTLL